MVLLLIILVISAILAVAGPIMMHKTVYSYDFEWVYNIGLYFVLFGVIVTVISAAMLIGMDISAEQELNLFIIQKEYIENYTPANDYDTAAITNKKVELNEWLYRVQYNKEHYPICSFYGDEILTLEPIK